MGTENRGFASMDRKKQQEIARLGGKAAHQKKTAHQWTPAEASVAGRKGAASRARQLGVGSAPLGTLVGESSADLDIQDPLHDFEVRRFADEGNPHAE